MNLNNTSPAKHSNKPIDTSIKSSIKSSFDDDGDNEVNIEPLQIESTKTSFKVSENRLESKHKLLDGDEWLDSKKAPSPSKKTNVTQKITFLTRLTLWVHFCEINMYEQKP